MTTMVTACTTQQCALHPNDSTKLLYYVITDPRLQYITQSRFLCYSFYEVVLSFYDVYLQFKVTH